MNGNEKEDRFLEKAKDLLNEGAEDLDSKTLQRLQDIRIRALRATEEKRSGFSISLRWVMVGGCATATMAAMALFLWLSTSPQILPVRQVEDFEIITSQERIDFYQNLDFYRWLATRENGEVKGRAS